MTLVQVTRRPVTGFMSRFLDICCPITGDLRATISTFATTDKMRRYCGTSCLCRGRRAGLPCFSHCFLHCRREVGLADVIHSGAVINNHTGNHCHWSEETYSMRLSNVNCLTVREVGLGRYSRIFHLSHTHCGTAPFFTRPRLNRSHRWHKI